MSNIRRLAEKYKLEIVSPFKFVVNDKKYTFDALIKGYGAKNGMVVDGQYERLKPVLDELMNKAMALAALIFLIQMKGLMKS